LKESKASRGLSGNFPLDWVADVREICIQTLKGFLVEWLRQFPLLSFAPSAYVLDAEPGSYLISGSDVYPKVVRLPAQALSMEQRVAQLEGRQDEQENLIQQIQASIAEAMRRQKEALQSESHRRESADRILRAKLEGLATGRLHLEMIGLVWLLLGVTLGTAPGEVIWIFVMLIHMIMFVFTSVTTLLWKIFS
jgi:hypothetical protein